MKKIFTVTAMLFTAVALTNCTTSPANKSQLTDNVESYQTEGWLDQNTLQVKGLGAPAPEATGFVKRRTQSKEAALLAAQKRVIEMCVGATIAGASGSDSGESTGIAITKEFEGVMKGGNIIRENYDSSDNCELVYRVESNNFKKQCAAMAAKQDFR